MNAIEIKNLFGSFFSIIILTNKIKRCIIIL